MTGQQAISCAITPDIRTATMLSFNDQTCEISGTPGKVASEQTYTVVAVGDGNYGSASTTIKVQVRHSPRPVVIDPLL